MEIEFACSSPELVHYLSEPMTGWKTIQEKRDGGFW